MKNIYVYYKLNKLQIIVIEATLFSQSSVGPILNASQQ